MHIRTAYVESLQPSGDLTAACDLHCMANDCNPRSWSSAHLRHDSSTSAPAITLRYA